MDLADKPSSAEQSEQINPSNELYAILEQQGKKPAEDRFIMLCDGIFAISITLLVINIKLPDGLGESQFNAALRTELLFGILFYAVTFAIIASYWRLHHRMMHILKRLDSRFITINFVFLAFVAFFPVSSSFLAQSHLYASVVVFYTLTIAGCGFSALAMWLYAAWHHRLVEQTLEHEEIIAFSIRIANASVYFCLTLLLLLVPFIRIHQPIDVFWSWLLLPVLAFLVPRVSHGRLTRWFARFIKPIRETTHPVGEIAPVQLEEETAVTEEKPTTVEQ